jgi:hypothetical protein
MSRRVVAALTILLFLSAPALQAQTAAPVTPDEPSTPASVPVSDPASTADCPKETLVQQPVPDAPSALKQLTPKDKFQTFVKSTYSPYTFATAAIGASWSQLWDDWPTYGGGMSGWGKRYGATLANTDGRRFFNNFLFPVMFRQDPRYLPSNKHGMLSRAWYASTRVVVGRGDDGNSMFNYSEFLSVLAISSIQNSYYPERERGFPDTLGRFAGGLSSDVTGNILKEFTPDLKRVARKIIPKRAQKLEEKIPGPMRKIGGMQ